MKARSTSAYQSSQRVTAMSCQRVPWPGSRGSSTVKPGRGEVLGPGAHRLGGAGEPVEHEHADRAAVVGEGLGAGEEGHGWLLEVGRRTAGSDEGFVVARSDRPPVWTVTRGLRSRA